MVVAGCGVDDIQAYNASDSQLYAEYSTGLVRLVQPADELVKRGGRFLWMVQDPIVKEILPAHLSGIENRQINVCNKAAKEVNILQKS